MFEIDNASIFGSAETFGGDPQRLAVPVINTAISQMTDGPRKIVLPRRPGEPRFAPPQYYYPASRTGVLPCWRAGT
jgi:hypothetical protein